MTPLATILLALSLSADAFAVAASKGATLRHPKPLEAARIGGIFGITEALTALVGWCLGFAASSFITTVDHWIAFAILLVLGVKMIVESFLPEREKIDKPCRHKICTLVFAAIGSSIDSMGVGVTLAFIDANIWITAAAIGLATFTMSTLGVMIGHAIGQRVGKMAEALGGAVLIAVGTRILIEHLSAV